MKPRFSIIMPVVDWPVGSGQPHHFLRESILGVLNGGYDDFELLMGADGPQPAIEEVWKSFNDERIRYCEFKETHSYGNHQRHWLMKAHATGTHVLFMDHDDRYLPGALAEVAEEAGMFPDRALFFRVIWPPAIVAGRPMCRTSNISALTMCVPRLKDTPIWPDSPDPKADHDWIKKVRAWKYDLGDRVLFIETKLAECRPWQTPEIYAG